MRSREVGHCEAYTAVDRAWRTLYGQTVRPLAELRDYGNHNCGDQHDAQSDPQSHYPTLKRAFALGMELESLQECDAAGDAAMPPRSTIGVQSVTTGDIREGVRENADSHGTEHRLLAPYGRCGKVVVQVGVWWAIRQITRNHLAAEHIGLTLESPRNLTKNEPKIQTQECQEQHALNDFAKDRRMSTESARPVERTRDRIGTPFHRKSRARPSFP